MALIDELKKDATPLQVGKILISEEMNKDLKYIKTQGISVTDMVILALKKLPVSRIVKELKEAEKAEDKSTDSTSKTKQSNISNDISSNIPNIKQKR